MFLNAFDSVFNIMAYKVMTYDVMTYDVMTYDVMTYDVRTRVRKMFKPSSEPLTGNPNLPHNKSNFLKE